MSEAAALHQAATARPESGFNSETGELRIGETVFRPRRFTRARRKEIGAIGDAKHAATASSLRGKLERGEAITEQEFQRLQEASDEILDLAFKRLVVLFHDDNGNAPSVDMAMEELTDEDAQNAVAYVTENPTGQTTATSSG